MLNVLGADLDVLTPWHGALMKILKGLQTLMLEGTDRRMVFCTPDVTERA